MSNHDWSRFTVRITVNASPKELYKSWTTKAGLEKWFLRLAEFKKPDSGIRSQVEHVEKGDTYRWFWHGWSDDMMEKGTILESNGRDCFKFIFGSAGNCTVNIKTEEGEHVVELIQEEIPTDALAMQNYHLGCKTGWTFYLANLKSILEGGVDLRNKNERIKKVINS